MRRLFGKPILLTVTISLMSAPLLAHHGDARRFDERTISLSGTVVAVQLVNPHATILFSVASDSGEPVTWQAELGSPSQLVTSFGWTRNTLRPGSRITVTGRPLKSGSPYVNLTERARIVLTDTCTEIYHSNTLPDDTMACESTGS